MSAKNRSERKTVGYGYVGRWRDGTLGWMLPAHLGGYARPAEPPSDLFQQIALPKDRVVLCRITVEVIKDSLGREITRKAAKHRKPRP